jgi:hypothetical protein
MCVVYSSAGGARMSVSYECCMLSSRGLCVGLITHPEESSEWDVSACDREASIMWRPWPTRGCCCMEIKMIFSQWTVIFYLIIISTFTQQDICVQSRKPHKSGLN